MTPETENVTSSSTTEAVNASEPSATVIQVTEVTTDSDDGEDTTAEVADATVENSEIQDDALDNDAGERVMYPGPAESPRTASHLFTRVVWRADLDKDWYALSALRLAVERRLREIGVHQLGDTARGLEAMAFFVNRDEMYVVREGPTAIGCFALTSLPDHDFWADDPDRHECLYLRQVLVAPWATGTGVGEFIINHVMSEARDRKCSAVRLDTWYANEKLWQHWEGLGFTSLRTADAPGRDTSVLMERRLTPLAGPDTEAENDI